MKTNIFSFPFEFWLSEEWRLINEYFQFNQLPFWYRFQLMKLYNKLKFHKALWEKNTVEKWLIKKFGHLDIGKSKSTNLFNLSKEVAEFCWGQEKQLTIKDLHFINHIGGGILTNWSYFMTLPRNKLIITIREPNDTIVSAIKVDKKRTAAMIPFIIFSYIIGALMTKIYILSYPGRVFILSLNDITTMNKYFYEILTKLDIDVNSIDLSPTLLGQPWKGNSVKGKIEHEKVHISHDALPLSNPLNDNLINLYKVLDSLKGTFSIDQIDLEPEVTLINKLMGKQCFNSHSLVNEKLSNPTLNRIMDDLIYISKNSSFLFLNHKWFYQEIIKSFPGLNSLGLIKSYINRLKHRNEMRQAFKYRAYIPLDGFVDLKAKHFVNYINNIEEPKVHQYC